MLIDNELYRALRAGLSDLSEKQKRVLRLIWDHPNVPVYVLPTVIGLKHSGYIWLMLGDGIGKKKLYRLMPARIKRAYQHFYVGLIVNLHTVEDRLRRRLQVFELRDEAVKALQELKIIGREPGAPSEKYRRLDEISDDDVPSGFSAPAETRRVNRSIVARRGQRQFKQHLMSVYGGECAVTGCDERNALEAAHIVEFKKKGRYEAKNGLLLRSDWHTLFDLGLWTIHPVHSTILLSPKIISRDYTKYRGRKITQPDDPTCAPDRDTLNKRYKRFKKLASQF